MKPPKAEKETKSELQTAWVGLLGVVLGGLIASFVQIYMGLRQEEREVTVARIRAEPHLWIHIDYIYTGRREDRPKVLVLNNGPVAATSLIVLVDQCQFTNSNQGGFGAQLSGFQLQGNRPWFLMTNTLPGGCVLEGITSHIALLPASNHLYRVEARYYPEFNFNRQLTNVAYFAEVNGILLPARRARRFLPEFNQLTNLFEKRLAGLDR